MKVTLGENGHYTVKGDQGPNWWTAAYDPGMAVHNWRITNRKGVRVDPTGRLGKQILAAVESFEKGQFAPVEHHFDELPVTTEEPHYGTLTYEAKPHLDLVEDITNNADLSTLHPIQAAHLQGLCEGFLDRLKSWDEEDRQMALAHSGADRHLSEEEDEC